MVTLWQQLAHDRVLSDVDLAAWMNTSLASIDGRTPAETADRHGVDDEALGRQCPGLRARAA